MNSKNLLTKDIIPQPLFQKGMIGILALMLLFVLYSGYVELQSFQKVFHGEELTEHPETYEIGYLSITKVPLPDENTLNSNRFVTITGLSYPDAAWKQVQVMVQSPADRKMTGLVSHPSFRVTSGNESFWRSQFYWVLAYHAGGYSLLGFLILGLGVLAFRQNQKLFTREMKYGFFALYGLIMGGFFLHAVLFGRMVYFLNQNYYLGESLTAGVSQELLSIATVLLILIIFIEKAIPVQQDQDLTV